VQAKANVFSAKKGGLDHTRCGGSCVRSRLADGMKEANDGTRGRRDPAPPFVTCVRVTADRWSARPSPALP
jgi:hypothetical protein